MKIMNIEENVYLLVFNNLLITISEVRQELRSKVIGLVGLNI